MKKFIRLFTFLALLFLLTNCEKETILEQETSSTILETPTENLIETLTFDELSSDYEFSEISTAFKIDQPFETVKKSGKAEDSIHEGLDIDYTSVKKVKDKNGISFTFLIKSEEKEPTVFDNLVIEKRKDGEIRGYLMRYQYSENYIENFKKGILLPFEGKIKRTPYSTDVKALKKLLKKAKEGVKTKAIVCVETTVSFASLCPWGNHKNGVYCDGLDRTWYGYRNETVVTCFSSGWGFSNYWYIKPLGGPSTDSNGGPLYTPTTPNEPTILDDVEDIQHFINKYSLEGAEIEWARNRANRNKVYFFHEEYGYGDLADKEVQGQIELEALTNDLSWQKVSGKIENRDDFKYTHRAQKGSYIYYRMEDGSQVSSSLVPLILNNNGKLQDIGITEVSNGRYYYIKPIETGVWATLIIGQQPGLATELETMFKLGLIDFAHVLGTYVLPVEDIKIIIDGKDFNGQQASRWLATGFLVTSVVPGSKFVKVVKVVPTNAFNWTKVIAVGSKNVKLNFEKINGIVDFGSSGSKLRTILGITDSSFQAHHIIPWAKRTHDAVQKAAKSSKAFHINEALNGIPMHTDFHFGSHPNYSNLVQQRLDAINLGQTADEVFDEVLDIISDIRTAIQNNPTTHINQLTF
ncbi:AHH domain-containing protein [Aureibaculum sp. 2210JD6-5]|uniref:AHH domain-containing protein n=1 Tax=Aureibaculum sp. 2210JD6-5 TaxID=3103957 RepID=UPI002AAC5ABC|nr:AHH domain-containing protein [Aureibaculum sp. 2210JD6-5]MDY7395726.1 AHH domain-containing protein [Aureibaculum sp. 2210JD6-5]